jgi:hypothetical protein
LCLVRLPNFTLADEFKMAEAALVSCRRATRIFTDLAEEIVVLTVTCCYLPTEHKASDDVSETNSSEDIT